MTAKRTHWDYRLICPCQQHGGRRTVIRWARLAAGHLQRRAIGIVVGIPLAFGALGFPMDAMNVSFPMLQAKAPAAVALVKPAFHISTTPEIRRTFMADPQPQQLFTLEAAKEQFFDSEVPYGGIIYREARRNDLPPELVAA